MTDKTEKADGMSDPDGRQLVKELGTGKVAKALRRPQANVSNWLKRGVPRADRPLVAQLAERHGREIPQGFLPKLPEAGFE
ncbi:hypothetical protein JJL56_28075 [Azospirillum sp. YIM DDC1]|uniref:Helix-turn-helix domain-containing protein n=1 Tax=Azospirillum aestuarii TaxID=2802052 RepID=A0ABS1I713_9PROT|nr:hypothetical protein [Azospirillum aestuarii]MBK4722719.1 hypothetical protein [Azospirillum aestuarii]